jgi:uncharacterized surface protein with fasciclin (FAS1) repeats
MRGLQKLAAAAAMIGALALGTAARAQDIVDTAVKAGNFETLVAAVKAAGLAETLKGKGPYTVFAPTDEAFRNLPAGTLDTLLKPENKATLTAVLTYHVVAGEYPAERLVKAKAKNYDVASVEGSPVNVDTTSGVKVSGATVTKTDIKTSNGTIHVIDRVILPPKVKVTLAKPAAKQN